MNKDNASECTCSKCERKTYSQNGKLHRRCGGAKDAPLRPKHDLLEPGKRGTWQ